jgi:hypothetical protein
VGKTIRINKHPYTIVGDAQKGFFGAEKFLQLDLFVPMANQASLEGVSWLEQWHDKNVFCIVRIKDGVTLPQVQAELSTIAARLQREHQKEEKKLGFKLSRPSLVGDYIGGPAGATAGRSLGLAFTKSTPAALAALVIVVTVTAPRAVISVLSCTAAP